MLEQLSRHPAPAMVEADSAVVDLKHHLPAQSLALVRKIFEHLDLHLILREHLIAVVELKVRVERLDRAILRRETIRRQAGLLLKLVGGDLLYILIVPALVDELVAKVGLVMALSLVLALAHLATHLLALVARKHDFLVLVHLAV